MCLPQVNLRDGQVVVAFQPEILKSDYIATIISDMGYNAVVQEEFKHSPNTSINSPSTSDYHKSIIIQVGGMVCINCAQIIESNLRKKKGIKQISVSIEEKIAHVLYDPNVLSINNICSAIEDVGFEATLPTSVQFDYMLPTLSEVPASTHGHQSCVIKIKGMTCLSCVQLIESQLGDLEAVESIQVLLQEEEARIMYNADLTTAKELAALIDDLGYTVTNVDGMCGNVHFAITMTLTCRCCCNVGRQACEGFNISRR